MKKKKDEKPLFGEDMSDEEVLLILIAAFAFGFVFSFAMFEMYYGVLRR